LFERMELLSVEYQKERGDLEVRDPVRVAIKALAILIRNSSELEFSPKELALSMNAVVQEEEPQEDGKEFTNPRKVGWLLKRLRFSKETPTNSKRWRVSRTELSSLARAYGMEIPERAPDGTS